MTSKLQTAPQTFAKETQTFLKTFEDLKKSDTGLALAQFASSKQMPFKRNYIKIGPRRAAEKKYGGGEAL